MRAYRGYGQINQFWGRGWNKYHSIQTSFNRRFTNGLSFGLNWTLGLSNTTNAGARLEHAPDGTLRYRADQEEADRVLGRGQLQRHTIKGHLRVGSAGPRAKARARPGTCSRRWLERLAAVGDLHGAVRRSLQHRVQLSGRASET